MTTNSKIRRTTSSAVRIRWVAIVALLVACDGPVMQENEEATYADFEDPGPAPGLASILPTSRPQTAPVGPRLMRSGWARIEVTDLRISLADAEAIATSANGYVVGSELSDGREGARTASLTVRLPSDSFAGVIERLSEVGRVLSASSAAQDVSREYVDVETRLSVGEETVARLRALASRTGNLEDMLAAERELARALTELEGLKGQLRYYDQRVAESDLSITLIEPGAVVAPSVFQPVTDALRDAGENLVRSVASVIDAAAFFAPWLVVTALLWMLLGRRLRTRGARRRAATV